VKKSQCKSTKLTFSRGLVRCEQNKNHAGNHFVKVKNKGQIEWEPGHGLGEHLPPIPDADVEKMAKRLHKVGGFVEPYKHSAQPAFRLMAKFVINLVWESQWVSK